MSDSVKKVAADIAKLARRYGEDAAGNMHSMSSASPGKVERELDEFAKRLRALDRAAIATSQPETAQDRQSGIRIPPNGSGRLRGNVER